MLAALGVETHSSKFLQDLQPGSPAFWLPSQTAVTQRVLPNVYKEHWTKNKTSG